MADTTETTPKTRQPKATSTIEAAANPVPTLTQEALANLLNEITQSRKELAELKQAMAAKPAVAANGKSDISTENERRTKKAFERAGFKDVQPRINILTFNRWIEKGFRPIEGSKSLKISGMRLFHISQVRELTSAELKARKDQPEAKPSKGAKVVPIHEVSPQ
jgi:hypothetical protein